MKTRLFKTKKLAEAYIRENYTNAILKNSYITEESEYDTDMVNLQWSGETPAYDVIDDNDGLVARIAWWEEGADEYELYINNVCKGTFDNHYDAREAYDKAMEAEEYKDEDEEVFEVKLLCNGEDISN